MPWQLGGNSGTNPASTFLGTTDNQPLAIRTNALERMRITNNTLRILTDENPILFSSSWHAFPDPATNRAEISNDTGNFKTLMIVGNRSAGLGRRVSIWDRLEVNGDMLTCLNPILFSRGWNAFPDPATNRAEISNDTGNFKTLMIVGNRSAGLGPGLGRRVSVWDRLEVNGELEVKGDLAVTGDITLTNADCAEEFDIAAAASYEPGTVMTLGEEGTLHQSHQAYDKGVAGVVSGAGDYKPGLILDKQQLQSNRIPVALFGKVYCKVDASDAAIEVGDLLTTSDTPGYAMKATDPLRAFGAVVGKALRPLSAGQGMIPVLAALQ